jgi:hypothetical protein
MARRVMGVRIGGGRGGKAEGASGVIQVTCGMNGRAGRGKGRGARIAGEEVEARRGSPWTDGGRAVKMGGRAAESDRAVGSGKVAGIGRIVTTRRERPVAKKGELQQGTGAKAAGSELGVEREVSRRGVKVGMVYRLFSTNMRVCQRVLPVLPVLLME